MFCHHFSDTQPATGIHVADFDDVRLHQIPHCSGFELQMFPGFQRGVFIHDEIDDLFRMRHGVAPAIHTGLIECCDLLRILLQFCL